MKSGIRALLAANIHRLRKEAGMTQAQLAERADISQQVVSGLEAGERNPTLVTLEALADALGVMPHELLTPVRRRR